MTLVNPSAQARWLHKSREANRKEGKRHEERSRGFSDTLRKKNIAWWRERNQQDATNLMFIIKLLSRHISGIIMPIIRGTRMCTAANGVLHWLWWLWLCGAGTRAVCTQLFYIRNWFICTM